VKRCGCPIAIKRSSRFLRIPAVGLDKTPRVSSGDFRAAGRGGRRALMNLNVWRTTIEAVTDAVSTAWPPRSIRMTPRGTSTLGIGPGATARPGPEGEARTSSPFRIAAVEFSAVKASNLTLHNWIFTKIELGSLLGGRVQGVDYARVWLTSPKSRPANDSESEKRLYFMWATPKSA